MNGGWLAAEDASLPLALQPAKPMAQMQRTPAARGIILGIEVI
jgi:hypothetical protein